MIQHWTLDERGEPKPCSMDEWLLLWAEPKSRIVKQDRFEGGAMDGILVSTVFLGLDHNYNPDSNIPILWETMIFGGDFDDYQDRCSGGREQAEAMHQRALDKVNGVETRAFNFED